MKKVLFLSNTANFSKFNHPYMRWFKEQGWQVDYCSAGLARTQKTTHRKSLRHPALPHAHGRCYRAACGEKTLARGQNQGDLHGARLSFLQGRAARELASVLSHGKVAFCLHGCDCNYKRGRL